MSVARTRLCSRCKGPVWEEHDQDLSKEYKYYCSDCDENMFEFETEIGDVDYEPRD
jgi:hypothetical protein